MKPSDDYQKLRERLRAAEIELKEQRERVAELRRQLPLDTVVDDLVFRQANEQGQVEDVQLSTLFADPNKPLVLLHFMYGKKQESPCPMCSLWADGYSGLQDHLRQRINFAVLIAGDPLKFSRFAQNKGWDSLRVVSAGDTTLKQEVGVEMPDGSQLPGVSVFRRGNDGTIHHFYSGSAMLGGGHFRGMDLLSPFWNILDLTPEGRGDFMPSLSYD